MTAATQETSGTKPERPLRVALFSGNYNYVMDGPVRALNKLVSHLEIRGHQALAFAPTVAKPAFEHSGELVSIPSAALPGSRSEYRFGFGLWGSAKRRLEQFAPTLIHIAAPDLTGYNALNFAEKNNIPVVASFHTRFDTYPRYYGAPWLEKYVTGYMRKFYARCAQVYTPSQSMTDELLSDGIGNDIRLWTRGVDHELFNPGQRDALWRREIGFSDDDIVIAFVGRVVLEKGIDVFCDALTMAQRENPKIRALVVGEGPERARFERHLPNGVFIGFQAGAPLARAYASADIFFNPSITETFGNVTLEAMASGNPCVCAAASGSKSLVEHGYNGLLSDPAAGPTGFAQALCALAADNAKRAVMAQNALSRSKNYTWQATIDHLIANYTEALEGPI